MCDAQEPNTLSGGAKNEKLHSFSCESVPLHSHTRKPAWKPHAKPPVSLNDKFIVRTKFTFHIHKSILYLSPFLLFFFKHSGSNPVQYRPVLGSVYQAGSYFRAEKCNEHALTFLPRSPGRVWKNGGIWNILLPKNKMFPLITCKDQAICLQKLQAVVITLSLLNFLEEYLIVKRTLTTLISLRCTGNVHA